MFCNSCGTQLKDGARFCPKCGAAVDEAPAITPQPVVTPAPAVQPVESVPQQQYAPAPVNMANMPSTGTATLLVIIGCLCGIIWGVYGFTKLKPMKAAIAQGDAETANKCFKSIRTATIIGVVVNILLIIGNMAQAGAI